MIHWWLKRRWSRLAVITAVASRHDALRYVGGAAQRQAAAQHARAQDQDDWRVDGAFREAESEGFSQGWEARFKAQLNGTQSVLSTSVNQSTIKLSF